MIFVEWMSPMGHIELNTFILSNLKNKNDILLASRGISKMYASFAPLEFRSSSKNTFMRLCSTLSVLKAIPEHSEKKVCFLSYDIIFIPLVAQWLRFRGWEIFLYEHNTVPTSKIKTFFQKLAGRSVTHICLAPFIAEVFKNLSLNTFPSELPVLTKQRVDENASNGTFSALFQSKRYSRIVFCPSASVDFFHILKFARTYRDFLFIIKTNRTTSLENVVTRPFFSDYLEVLAICDVVYIPFEPKYRVSAPLYEAIGMRKIVIVKRNQFGSFAKARFGNQIQYENDDWSIKFNSEEFDIELYNTNIVHQLRKLFTGEFSREDTKFRP